MKKSMQSVFLAFVVLAVLLSGCGTAPKPTPPTPSTTSTVSITKWEYMELMLICMPDPMFGILEDCFIPPDSSRKYSSRVAALNDLGQLGWEVIYIDTPDQFTTFFGLKRLLIGK